MADHPSDKPDDDVYARLNAFCPGRSGDQRKKHLCPDCHFCQFCGDRRCEQCLADQQRARARPAPGGPVGTSNPESQSGATPALAPAPALERLASGEPGAVAVSAASASPASPARASMVAPGSSPPPATESEEC